MQVIPKIVKVPGPKQQLVIVKVPAKVPTIRVPDRFPKEREEVIAGFTRDAWRRVASEKDVWRIHKQTPGYTIKIIIPAFMEKRTFEPSRSSRRVATRCLGGL